MNRTQQTLEVGIVTAPQIRFKLSGGVPRTISANDGRLVLDGAIFDELTFETNGNQSEEQFTLYGVTIGIDFHWQRRQDQHFCGALKFIPDGPNVTAVNIVGIEDYLMSVISSEMNPESPLEYLKAHAIISRSWVLARVHDRRNAGKPGVKTPAHELFDVCADDHCQRYQGIPDTIPDNVRRAVEETWGQTLSFHGSLCDTRFSKCCGGRSELFSTCWEDEDPSYLQSVPDPYCDCSDRRLLSKVLKDYDLETTDFHDWEVRYTRDGLSELVKRRTGIDFGTVEALEPLERGASGRIKYMRIRGTLRSATIGKELAIRRALSSSHLKSSWFDVTWEGDTVVLRGKGWGHGVGLCQIGAAVMADKGFNCEQILKYYYVESEIE